MEEKIELWKSIVRTNKFAFTADLVASRFTATQIEEAVNSGLLRATSFPRTKRATDFYWLNDESAEQELQKLADEAVQYCGGIDLNDSVGGDFAGVGVQMGSQQMALAGLIYAREQGRLIEVEELDRGTGPLYVNSKSPLAKVFLRE